MRASAWAIAVGEAGAGGVDVVGGGGVGADAVGDDGATSTGSAATLLIVATITASICSGAMPDFSIASRGGIRRQVDRRGRPCDARVRVMMPVRWRIHSSLESIGPTRSSLGTTRSPRAAP